VRSTLLWLDSILEKKSSRKISTSSNRAEPSVFSKLCVKDTLARLKQDGLSEGLFLPPALLETLLSFVATHDCYAGGNQNLGFNISQFDDMIQAYGNTFYSAYYFNVSEQCSAVSKIVNDSKISMIAEAYLGKRAQYVGCDLLWTFPVKDASLDVDKAESCKFHYDLWDYSSLKFFFYLSDVETHGGQHVCVKHTHRYKRLHHVANFSTRRQSDREMVNTYGYDCIQEILGGPGYGFVEDMSCYHKGTIPKTQPRLALILHFAVNKYGNDVDYRDPLKLKHVRLSQYA